MNADFDAGYYLTQNPDVAAAGVDPLQHYLTYGWKEGRNPNAFFDTRYYLDHNPDVAAAGVNPLLHFEQSGWTEGRDPSAAFSTRQYLLVNKDIAATHADPLAEFLAEGRAQGRLPRYDIDFDRAYYLSHNPDVAAAGVDPFDHYVTTGWKEGRDPSAFFDTRFYLTHNPDVAAAGVNPLVHYEQSGWKEGRDASAGFSTRQYLLVNADIAATHADPLAEFLAEGQAQGRLGRYDGDFDRTYYLAHNPDVAANGVDPFTHYVTTGWKEGRDPSAFFNTRFYLAQNPDVAAAGVDPLVHYEQSGWKEGRNPSALFDTRAYLAQNPDVAAAGLDPLRHYLAFGQFEGRGTGTTPGTAPTADLATAFRLGAAGDHLAGAPVVELVGKADAGSTVRLLGTSLSAVADASGEYRLAGVGLNQGHNLLNLSATDPAGRVGLATIDVTRTAATAGTVVADWDRAVIDAIKAIGSDPQFASRAMAIESIAVLDVVNAIQGKPGFLVSLAAPAGLSETAAIAQAAHDVLVYLYPTRAGVFDAQLAQSLSTLPYGTQTAASLAFGKSVAAAVVAIRDRDGWNRIVTDDGSTAPGKWRPTAPDFMLAQDPQWARVTPFTLTSDSQFRAPAPPAIGSAEYQAGLAYLQAIGKSNSTLRTADQTQIARFWADGAGTETPPGHWNDIARQVVTALNLDADTAARVLAEVNVAMADSAFAGWDTKFFYDEERPITAIRTGDVGNVADPSWSPLIKTPPHPSYVSGHSTFSAAASTVLASIFGTSFAFSTTDDTLPGVIRSFASFDAAAQEAAISRVYGGIHFTWDSTAGLVMGKQVGQSAISAFEKGNDAAPMLLLDQSGAINATGPVTLSGYALDSTAPLTGLLASLDGGAGVRVAVDAAGRFSFTSDVFGAIATGTHTLMLSATDGTGHTTTIPVPFTRGSGGLSLSLTSPGTAGVIAAGAHLTGRVASTSAAVTSLTYAFDGGVATPVLRGTDGSFDTALDLSKLAAGAHTLTVRATDASGGETIVTAAETLQVPVPLTVVALTPLNGAGEIGVTYRPEVTFSRPVDVSTLTQASFYATDPAGTVLAATIIPRADGTGASLFFNAPLPGAATVTLHVVGSLIRAQGDGATLDAAGTGVSGSTRTSTLGTVNTAIVPGTTLTGIIADPGPDLQPLDADDVRNNSDGSKTYLLPIAGAKVYILGHESEAVYTDAQGRFTLTNVPTGSVKVAVDGRTATNPPNGVFFPEMVMDVQVTPGIVNTLPGGMGTAEEMAAHKTTLGVYLPRVQTSILTTVSASAPTVVTVPVEAAGLLSDAQRSMLSLTIQPGSVVGADGQAVQGAKVGISPVPADLVKDMLPSGLLQHTFDITIQAPGGAAFTTPAQLTLPNVFGLAAGEKTYFLSFDHTTGKLVIDGTATVSADGLTVTTDPGAGVTKPGWHGMTPPGSTSEGPGSDAEEVDFAATDPEAGPGCFSKIFDASKLNLLKNALDCAKEFAKPVKALVDIAKNVTDLADNLKQLKSNLKAVEDARQAHQSDAQIAAQAAALNNKCASVAAVFNTLKEAFNVESSEVRVGVTCLSAALDSLNAICGNAVSAGCLSVAESVIICGTLNGLNTTLKLLVDTLNVVEGKLVNAAVTTTCDLIAHVANQLGAVQQPSPGGDPLPGAVDLILPDGTVVPGGPVFRAAADTGDIDSLFTATDAAIAANIAATGELGRSFTAVSVPPQSQLDALGTNAALIERSVMGPPKDLFYEIKVAGQVYRGMTDGAGKLNFFFPANAPFTVSFYSPVLDVYAQYSGVSGLSGQKTVIPNPVFLSIADLPPATGPGGLPDLIEEIVGGSLTRADSLVPGVQDKVAVHLGVAATRSLLNTTGIIAAAPLQGTANQVVVAGSLMDSAGQYAYVATGGYGLAILDVSAPLKPVLLSETALPGNAVDVAVDARLGVAAVADGAGGLVLLNVGMLTMPSVIATVSLDARAVVAYEGVAYTTNGSSLVAVDMATGALLQRLVVTGAGTLTGVARDGATLWTIDSAGQLAGVAVGTGAMVQLGSVATGLAQAASARLYAAAGVVYVPDSGPTGAGSAGYATVDVSDGAHPAMLGTSKRTGAAGDAIALNGAGQGVGIGKPLGLGARLDVIDTTDPSRTGTLLTEFNLPAQAYGVAIGDGVAFVADGTAGLQVVNYKAIDTSGTGPSITVLTGPGGSAPGTGAVTLSEGSTAGFTVRLSDPGQIRNAELLVNGVAVVNDSSYPFELTAALPSIAAAGSNSVTLAVRATDTAGHVATTAPVTVTLTPDRVAPTLLSQSLVPGSVHSGSFRSFSYRFSKPIDPASLTASAFTLTGPSGTKVAPASIQARAGGQLVEVTYASLPAGSYTAGLSGAGITDRAGNVLGGSATTAFSIAAGNYSAGWSAPLTGDWSDALNWDGSRVPQESDSVLLLTEPGTKVIHSTGSDTVASIGLLGVLDLTGGTVTVNGAITDQSGSTLLLEGGTLAKAKVQGPGSVVLKSGTLDGVTLASDVTATGYVSAANGLTISGTMTASEFNLYGSKGTVLNTGTINFAPSANYLYSREYDGIAAGYQGSLTNRGTITASGTFMMLSLGSLTNSGTVSLADGVSLTLGNLVSNTGTFALGSRSSLTLNGTTSLAALGTVTGSNDTLVLGGTIDLTGRTLSAAALPAFATISLQGATLLGGTIVQDAAIALQANPYLTNGGTFDGTTWSNGLKIVGGTYTIRNGLTVQGGIDLHAGFSGYANLVFQGNQSLNGVAITMGSSDGTNGYQATITTDPAGSLTFGSGTTVSVDTGMATLGGYSSAIVNEGAISIAAKARLVVRNGSFTNHGTVNLAAGATLQLDGVTALTDITGLTGFTGSNGILAVNAGGATLNLQGGTLDSSLLPSAFGDVEFTSASLSNGTLRSGPATTIKSLSLSGVTLDGSFTNSGTLTLASGFATHGLVLTMVSDSAYGSAYLGVSTAQTLDRTTINVAQSLSGNNASIYGPLTLAASSALTIGAGASANLSGSIVNAGTITAGGTRLSVDGASFGNSGRLAASGGQVTITSTGFSNSGTVAVGAGGTLTVQSATLANGGTIDLAGSANLVVTKATTLAGLGTVTGSGTTTLYGKLDLGGGTLNLGASSGTLKLQGGVTNGTIREGTEAVAFGSGTVLDHTAILAADGSSVSTASLVAAGAATANADGSITFGPDGSTVFLAGPGAVVSPGGFSTIIGGGHDTFKLSSIETSSYYHTAATILNFDQAGGDVLDLSAIMAASTWDHSAATLGTYLSFSQSGSDTIVSGNPSGTYGYNSGTIAVLKNTSGITLASLETNNALRV